MSSNTKVNLKYSNIVYCKDCWRYNTSACYAAHWEADYCTEFDENGFCSGGEKEKPTDWTNEIKRYLPEYNICVLESS